MPDDTTATKGDTGGGQTESLLGGATATDQTATGGGDGAAATSDTQGAKPDAADTSKTDTKADAKGKADEKKSAVPEKYEFKAPEGLELDAAAVEVAVPVFKELGLSQEHAQKLIDLQASLAQKQADTFRATLTGWQKEVKAWPDSAKVLGDAKLAVQKLADKDTAGFLESSWIGSHPGVLKMLAAAGKILRESDIVEGKQAAADAPQDVADRLFGDRFTKK